MDRKIDIIPEGFTEHTDDSKYYPVGVNSHTKVDVIITHNDKMTLYENKEAQSFGWSIAPAVSSVPGQRSVSAPITHYKIL